MWKGCIYWVKGRWCEGGRACVGGGGACGGASTFHVPTTREFLSWKPAMLASSAATPPPPPAITSLARTAFPPPQRCHCCCCIHCFVCLTVTIQYNNVTILHLSYSISSIPTVMMLPLISTLSDVHRRQFPERH